jgi:mannose-6-phosphate isomerase-like protein (cupin superfamily)
VALLPQLQRLSDFYSGAARALPADRDFLHAPGLIDQPSFFTLEHLNAHLNNPMLMPYYFALYWQGKRVNCDTAVASKIVQGNEVKFLNKGVIQDYLSRGASLVLEGLDILEPEINAMCGAIDAANECVFSNSVVFFSQRGNEAYHGHVDTDDVLVIHLAGQKLWRIHERQAARWVELYDLPPARMGKVQAEVLLNPGDALFLRSGTPHQVRTTGEFSMHMSFDICDRRVNAETALHLLLEEYRRDAERPYTPTMELMGKMVTHAGGERFRERVAALQLQQKESYRKGRDMFETNRIRALDKWIGARPAAKGE